VTDRQTDRQIDRQTDDNRVIDALFSMAIACKNHDLCWWSVSDAYVVSIVLH